MRSRQAVILAGGCETWATQTEAPVDFINHSILVGDVFESGYG